MLQAVNNDSVLSDDPALQYMELSLGNASILVRQTDLFSIESIKDINSDSPANHSAGSIYVKEQKILVYSLSGQLELEQSIAKNKTVCAVLNKGNVLISLACMEIIPFKHQIIKLHSLPECMQASSCPETPAVPVGSLCLYKKDNDSDIKLVISTDSLTRFIDEHNV